MSQERQYNCLSGSPLPIRHQNDLPLHDESSQTLGGSLSGSVNATHVPAHIRASRRAMQSFVPRPFPPPALADVPVEYILDRLHNVALHYWSKPETADCTIIVPLDGLLRKTGQTSRSSGLPPFPMSAGKNGLLGQTDEMSLRPAPRMIMKVHSDYLSAHSALLRSLFSGASPLDFVGSTQSTPRGSVFDLPLRSESPAFMLPSAARGLPIAPLYPRLLPSTPTHPTIYLPVPDPASFRLLIHYMYFGSTAYIEEALDTSSVTWEGLARNVEYLGMDTDIKLCLGRWYSRWQRGREHESSGSHFEEYEDYSDSDDDDDSYFESDSEGYETESMTSASADEEDRMDIDECLKHVRINAPDVPTRGRQRTPRRLGHAISDPGPIRGRSRVVPHVSQSSSPSSRGMST